MSAIVACMFLGACSSSSNTKSDSAIEESAVQGAEAVNVERLDTILLHYPSMSAQERQDVLSNWPQLNVLMQMINAGDTATDATVGAFASSNIVKMFGPAAVSAFKGDIEAINAKGHETLDQLGIKVPEMVGVTLPYQQSVIFSGDSLAFISLNHWLGANHEAYKGFPEYIKRLKTPERLPIDIAEALVANAYPYNPGTNATVLSRLLYEGALVEAVMQVAQVDEATMLGLTKDEYERAKSGERYAWETLVTKKMLYDTDPQLQERLTQPSPATGILSPDLPGRMGRFIGHQLVKSLLKNEPSITTSDLLSPTIYTSQETLAKAKYVP